MEFKGTQGKWKYEESKQGIEVVKENSDFLIIYSLEESDLNRAGYSIQEYKANAKLISKSPELLQMLIEINKKLKSGKALQIQLKESRIEQLIKEATTI